MDLKMKWFKNQSCHDNSCKIISGQEKIILIGSPNVGKSVLFNLLSDSYAIASNYPGTTVEISKGNCKIENKTYEIIDTPGMYSFLPNTEEERVSQKLLFDENAYVYLHVVDAKNLVRMLSLTLQFLEADIPFILVLNMIDEAKEKNIQIDINKLSEILGIPVVATSAIKNEGINELKNAIYNYKQNTNFYKIKYDDEIELASKKIEEFLIEKSPISKKSRSLLLLQNDKTSIERIHENFALINPIVEETSKKFAYPLNYAISLERQNHSNKITDKVLKSSNDNKNESVTKIDKLISRPLTGIPILFLILYFGLYQFVGVFVAGSVVNYLENTIFGEMINPWIIKNFNLLVPFPLIQDLFVGEYGIFTQAVTYAIALIMPLVGSFFIVFSIIEDTGYLPRLAMLIDRVFKKIGLSGRAVIPMVLGFGCDTMATMVTRTLSTKREKIISCLLLSLAIPCSAQIGVILAILSNKPLGLFIWTLVIIFEFIFIGFLASKIMPGNKPSFIMELPPLRLPKLSNVAIKTYSRMHWYFFEVLPLFVAASILIWIGKLTGLFEIAIKLFQYPTQWVGLPSEASIVFLYGFFRRDFGAAGLYAMNEAGILSGVQLVVAAITLTLFIPCVAQFMMTVKERGFKTAMAMALFIFPYAFLTGFLINYILTSIEVVI